MAPRNQDRPELREGTGTTRRSWRRWRRGAKSFSTETFAAERGAEQPRHVPKVVSPVAYLSDRRRSAKVRHNETVAHALRMQELIEESERRMIASDRRLRRTSQSLSSSGSAKKDGTPSSSR
jgi:hypothetical protein